MKNVIKTTVFLFVSVFLFQGFQCASKEFGTAKTALKRGDTAVAITNLKQELIKNPQNTEAKLMLTDLTFKSAIGSDAAGKRVVSIPQLREAAKMSVDTYDEVKKPNDKNYLKSIQQSIWVMAFNDGIAYLNASKGGEMTAKIDSAIALWEVGKIVRPKNPSFLSLQNTAYAKAMNLEKEKSSAIEYTTLIIDNSQPFLDMGMYLDMPTNEAAGNLGTLEETKLDTTQRNGSDYYRKSDLYKKDGKQIYLYSGKGVDESEFIVKGWLYDVPENYLQNDVTWSETNLSPLINLAQNAYEAKQYDEAIKYLDQILLFIPNDRQVNQLKVQSYVNQGSGDVAVNELKELIKKDPNKKEYHLQLGDLYSEMEKYEEATDAYEAAVKVDPNFDYALRNLASVYKNRAARIQQVEVEKKEKDDKYEVKTELYFPLLEKSAEYFKRSTQTEMFKNDFDTYVELYNIYDVMDKEQEKKAAIKDLEKLENSIPDNREAAYYYKMLKIYSDEKMNADVTRISNIIKEKGH